MPQTKQKVEKVPVRQAVEQVLAGGKEMHYRVIAEQALERGIIRVRGASPNKKPNPDATVKTVRSYLAGEAKKPDGRVVRVGGLGEGTFKLRDKPKAVAAKVLAEAKAKPAKAKAPAKPRTPKQAKPASKAPTPAAK